MAHEFWVSVWLQNKCLVISDIKIWNVSSVVFVKYESYVKECHRSGLKGVMEMELLNVKFLLSLQW